MLKLKEFNMRIRHKPWAKPELDTCPFCIKHPENNKGNWGNSFPKNQPIHIELGCGKGGFISSAVTKYPNINFIAIDIKNEMLAMARRKIVQHLSENSLPADNIKIFIKNIAQIDTCFDSNDAVERIYINFCNPWPKQKHKKHRLTHQRLLEKYKVFLQPMGEIWFKTDDDNLFNESLGYFEKAKFEIKYRTFDLHSSNFFENIETEHERMFKEIGKTIKFLIAVNK